MKNKIVFSTIAALALSTSAFGAYEADLSTVKWTENVNSSDTAVKLSTLGWTAGKEAIETTIRGGSALNGDSAQVSSLTDSKTIIGALVVVTSKDTKQAALKKDSTYVIATADASKYSSVVNLKGKEESNKSLSSSDLLNDYVLSIKSLEKANAGKLVLNAVGGVEGSYDTTLTQATNFTDAAFKADITKEELINITDALAKLGADVSSVTKTEELANLKTAVAGVIGTALFDGGVIADYKQADNLKKAAKDAEYLQGAQSKMSQMLDTFIASAEDSAKASFVKSQLDEALQAHARYADAVEKIGVANDAIDSAVDAAYGNSGTRGTNYTGEFANIYKVGADATGAVITNKESLKTAIANKATELLNTTTEQSGDFNTGKKATLDELIAYVAKQTEGGTTALAALSGGSFTASNQGMQNDGQLAKFLKAVKSAIDTKSAISTTASDFNSKNTSDLISELSEMSAIATVLGSKEYISNYNTAITAAVAVEQTKLDTVATKQAELDKIYASLASSSAAGQEVAQSANEALGESLAQLAKADTSISSAMNELQKLMVDTKTGAKITEASVKTEAGAEWDSLSKEAKEALGTDGATKDAYQTYKVNQHNAAIQTAANNVANAVASAKKDSLAVEGLSTLNIQLNNMNKRLGEIRGLDGEIGVWLRTWGGKMSADNDSFKYYSTQLGADKKTAMKDGDLYLGVLVGYDNVKSDIKSNAYSVGAYASYIDNSGFFADGVMKFVSTKNERSGFDLSNQQTLLASIEGGYRFDMSDGFYVEPSLEFVTGHVGEYKSKEKGSNTTLKVDSFTPVVFKPQVFVGGSADAFTYRAGIGGVLSMQGQDASVEIANIAHNLNDAQVDGSSTIKLSKNNHGFASIGGSFKASENFRINLGVERSFGGDLTNDYEVNMTLRYGF